MGTLQLKPGTSWSETYARCVAEAPEAFESDRLLNLFDGRWQRVGRPGYHVNPVDGSSIQGPPQVDRATAASAVDAAVRQHADWSKVQLDERMLLEEGAVDLAHWPERLASAGEPLDLAKFVNHVQAEYIPHTVIVDCTASAQVADHYVSWLRRGIHVITPNKKANSGSMPYYRSLHEAGRAAGTHYLYEATVGAGLPVIQTLRDLRQTGDEITRIEGIFSGTLAYLFNVFDGRATFSSIVRAAREKGYTEPDPRDDLSGMDVARKLIILGREMGLTLEMSDVKVNGLVPKAVENCSVDEFMQRLPEFDGLMALKHSNAAKKNEVLRYVGRIDAEGHATVGLVRLDARHAFANIALTDNVVRFATRRYCDNPLIVQGPGAGPEVTAGGVFSDLLRLSAYLGAHL